MRERKRKKEINCSIRDFINEHTEGVCFICVSNHCKYRKRQGNALPPAKCAFIYLFKRAFSGRGNWI